MDIRQRPSPNFNDRKAAIDMLVLHYTGMESGDAALARMSDESAEVSAHYMVREDGQVDQLVAEDKRAWHAGVGSWQRDTDLNSCSIGIEIVNRGHEFLAADGSLDPYPAVQIEAVAALCQGILARHPIPQTRIVAHSDIAPARKEDPGEHFPWEALAEAGVGIWPEQLDGAGTRIEDLSDVILVGDTGVAVKAVQAQMAVIGYGVEASGEFDEATSKAVLAFQRRWLTMRLTGRVDVITAARLNQISRAYTAPMI